MASGDLPGSTHDTAAARIRNILAALHDTGLIALGDKGYHGYDETRRHVITPYKGRNKPESQKDANRANAQLKTWHILRKLRSCPRRAGRLATVVRQPHSVIMGVGRDQEDGHRVINFKVCWISKKTRWPSHGL